MAKLVGTAHAFRVGTVSTTPLAPLGTRVWDADGNEYLYVGASGVSKGAPVKLGGSPISLAKSVVGTDVNALGVASQDFPVTGFTYGCIGVRGTHPTLVPSGTAAGASVQPDNGTTAAGSAASVQTKIGLTLVAANNDGSYINVFWL